jgi:hypothetical protein
MCRIVNFKVYGSKEALNKAFGNHWTYIGRANRYAGLPQSPLANPFKASAFGGQQGATLPHYRRWLWKRIQDGDEGVVTALRDITEDSVLVCYCKPGPCHGDVVKAAAAWQRKARLETTGIAVFVSGHRDLTPVEFAEHYNGSASRGATSRPKTRHRFPRWPTTPLQQRFPHIWWLPNADGQRCSYDAGF